MKTIKKILKGIGFLLFSGVVIFIGLTVYLYILYHQPLQLPIPTGAYRVGRTEYDWIDENRLDPLSEVPNEKRELLIWIWYPASTTQPSARLPYLPSAWVNARDRDQRIGKFFEHDFSLI